MQLIRWPRRFRMCHTVAIYRRCNAEPIRSILLELRWRLFGHMLRLLDDTPASHAMASYFRSVDGAWLGLPLTTIVTKLSADLKSSGLGRLVSLVELELLRGITADTNTWRELYDNLPQNNNCYPCVITLLTYISQYLLRLFSVFWHMRIRGLLAMMQKCSLNSNNIFQVNNDREAEAISTHLLTCVLSKEHECSVM